MSEIHKLMQRQCNFVFGWFFSDVPNVKSELLHYGKPFFAISPTFSNLLAALLKLLFCFEYCIYINNKPECQEGRS